VLFAARRETTTEWISGASVALAVVAGNGLIWMAWWNEAPGLFAVLGVFIIVATPLGNWLREETSYEVSPAGIRVRRGPFRERIPIADVLEVRQERTRHRPGRCVVSVVVRRGDRIRVRMLHPTDCPAFIRRLALLDSGFRVEPGRIHRPAGQPG
jgi:hypothetical protein